MFNTNRNFPVTIENMTLENGGGNGADLLAQPTDDEIVTLDDVLVNGGSPGIGALIDSTGGGLVVEDSTIENIPAGADGINGEGGEITLEDSTISDSESANAGVVVFGPGAEINNSTLSGADRALVIADGAGPVDVTFSTFSNDVDDLVLGTGVTEGVEIGTSILDDECDIESTKIEDAGYNVVAHDSCFSDTSNKSLINVGRAAIGLGLLASNGGPTQTVAISSTSDAHDLAPAGICDATDQRGIARLQPGSSSCDVGAYQYVPPSLSSPAPASPTPALTPTPAPTTTPKPVVTLSGFSVNKHKGTATVKLRCAGAPCAGKLALSPTLHKKVELHGHEIDEKVVIVLGTHNYRLAAGASEEITIALDKTGRDDVKHASRKHPLSLSLSASTIGASIAKLHSSVT